MSTLPLRNDKRTTFKGKSAARWLRTPGQLCILVLTMGVCACKPPETPVVELAKAADQIACAPSGAGQFSNDCTVERNLDEGSLVLVVRHPDGGFRRFLRVDDGSGLEVADGMEPAKRHFAEQVLELAVGGDRYRFPASAMTSESSI